MTCRVCANTALRASCTSSAVLSKFSAMNGFSNVRGSLSGHDVNLLHGCAIVPSTYPLRQTNHIDAPAGVKAGITAPKRGRVDVLRRKRWYLVKSPEPGEHLHKRSHTLTRNSRQGNIQCPAGEFCPQHAPHPSVRATSLLLAVCGEYTGAVLPRFAYF